ncbi:hypothetical protein APS60_07295 [Cutibacterium acnes]|uniref:Uncharacterized protein n=1 Tax=Cutibacterium acnes TaxID=1747 RepID=A0AA44U593_CUTAC|nr:hypothetical protein APS59_07845 [Cutibacterium acnes]PGF24781.1 hypothetical protein B1B02_11140 [Cutibacterium acnes subsp. defendens]PGF24979.1 hypothetical protein B1B08_11705 [Cutibacterium acnes subsp. defendens]PGF44889.1 hypothetical protein B1B12_08830 [Cutibacterium acnes subsp. defendens]PGF55426.1 hypothetical protein B1C76_09430 [Cutibacterium acnes subsp. defendens]
MRRPYCQLCYSFSQQLAVPLVRDLTWEIHDDAHEMMSEHQMQAGRECNATINTVDTAWQKTCYADG